MSPAPHFKNMVSLSCLGRQCPQDVEVNKRGADFLLDKIERRAKICPKSLPHKDLKIIIFYLTNGQRAAIIYAQQGRFFRQFFTPESRCTLKKRKTIFPIFYLTNHGGYGILWLS